MAQRSVRMPASEFDRKLVVKAPDGRKILVKLIPASTTHSIVNLIPRGSVEVYEKNVLVYRVSVDRSPSDINFNPEPLPPPESYKPEKIEKPRRNVVARFLYG